MCRNTSNSIFRIIEHSITDRRISIVECKNRYLRFALHHRLIISLSIRWSGITLGIAGGTFLTYLTCYATTEPPKRPRRRITRENDSIIRKHPWHCSLAGHRKRVIGYWTRSRRPPKLMTEHAIREIRHFGCGRTKLSVNLITPFRMGLDYFRSLTEPTWSITGDEKCIRSRQVRRKV